MKQIYFSKSDYKLLEPYLSTLFISNGYVCIRVRYPDGKNRSIGVHRFLIIGAILGKRKLMVHHIDHNPLNNRRSNLQVVTASEHRRIHTESGKQKSLS